jgi:hypothetical protein
LATLIGCGACAAAPAFAYGLHEEFGTRPGLKGMLYLRLPLGASSSEADHPTSFGFSVKSELLSAHPAYQREKGPYLDMTRMNFDLLNLQFRTNGNVNGLDVAGFTALGANAALK